MPAPEAPPTPVGAVVVHHRRFPDVLVTVSAVLREGVAPDRCLVVDNSEDRQLFAQLTRRLPAQVRAIEIQNRGYADAVNTGVRELLSWAPSTRYLLVCTHEAQPLDGALHRLSEALDSDDALAVVGPALLFRAREDGALRTWSAGGRLTRVLRRPLHLSHGAPPGAVDRRPAVIRCQWLDGACCLYRAAVLRDNPLRPDFFLYLEDTELHTRLRRQGWSVACVPAARAIQASDGVPPYLQARNLQRFMGLHGTRAQRVLTVPAVILRRTAASVLAGSRPPVRAMLHGWLDGLRGRMGRPS